MDAAAAGTSPRSRSHSSRLTVGRIPPYSFTTTSVATRTTIATGIGRTKKRQQSCSGDDQHDDPGDGKDLSQQIESGCELEPEGDGERDRIGSLRDRQDEADSSERRPGDQDRFVPGDECEQDRSGSGQADAARRAETRFWRSRVRPPASRTEYSLIPAAVMPASAKIMAIAISDPTTT